MESRQPQLDAPISRLAEAQPEYRPVDVAHYMNRTYKRGEKWWNTLIYAFRPTDEERERIMLGGDIYISLLTFGDPPNPINIFAGKEDAAKAFGLDIVPEGIEWVKGGEYKYVPGWYFVNELEQYEGPYLSVSIAEKERIEYAARLDQQRKPEDFEFEKSHKDTRHIE